MPCRRAPCLLEVLKVIGAGELVAQSVTQPRTLVAATPSPDAAREPPSLDVPKPEGLAPTMALAIQAVVAAVAAGLIGRLRAAVAAAKAGRPVDAHRGIPGG